MPLTAATVTHTFLNADTTPASGSVEFTLTKAITNGGVTLVAASHVSAPLSSAGTISQALTSTLDPGTFPQDALWRCDLRVSGAPQESFEFPVPSGGVAVDLGALMPGQTTVG